MINQFDFDIVFISHNYHRIVNLKLIELSQLKITITFLQCFNKTHLSHWHSQNPKKGNSLLQ